MMKLSIGLRSALLVLTVIVATPAGIINAQQAPADNKQSNTQKASENNTQQTQVPVPSESMLAIVSQHPALCIAVLVAFAVHTRLHTRKTEKVPFSMQDLRKDFTDLLDSLNIFDSKLYKQLLFLFDKYVIGLPLKLDEAKTDTKDSEGQRVLIKGKKLIQKPFGAYGLFDAYVLRQAKKVTESLTSVGLLYVLFLHPDSMFAGQLLKTKAEYKMNEIKTSANNNNVQATSNA